MAPLLTISDLNVVYPDNGRRFVAVEGVSFNLARGEILGLVGESGAGKSTVGSAILGLLEPPGHIAGGSIRLDGEELVGHGNESLRKIRGRRIGMIFQDPSTALDPLVTIGRQLMETIQLHRQCGRGEARSIALNLLRQVGIQDPHLRMRHYPHQFSGGQRQRIVIAIALCGEPDVLIADEPTTGLDVSIQRQILDLIRDLAMERGLGVLLVTHDMGVINETADRVAIMYRGRLVEIGPTRQIIDAPRHEYTRSLIAAVPRTDRRLRRFILLASALHTVPRVEPVRAFFRDRSVEGGTDGPLLEIKDLNITFLTRKALLRSNRQFLHALKDVSFQVRRGQTFGIVGESGSGKSTLAKVILGLLPPQSGSIRIEGRDLTSRTAVEDARQIQMRMQMIFQDPFASLNPRRRVGDIIAEPLHVHRLAEPGEIGNIVGSLLECVGMKPDAAARFPHQFSGGQRQRISIARALAMRPHFLVCDEPTSSLDVSVQAQILNLLKDIQEELGLTMLFVSHDLAVIRQMCDRIGVMHHGELCEVAETDQLFVRPQHDYTKSLLAMMPKFATRLAPGDLEPETASRVRHI